MKKGWRADSWLGVHRVRKTLPTKKSYEIPINDALKSLLQDLANGGTQGKILDLPNLQKEWAKSVKTAGLKGCRIHTLRHFYLNAV